LRRAGEPITLCWQLERSGGTAEGDPRDVVVSYEVAAEAEGWRPRGRRSGAPSRDLLPASLPSPARFTCPLPAYSGVPASLSVLRPHAGMAVLPCELMCFASLPRILHKAQARRGLSLGRGTPALPGRIATMCKLTDARALGTAGTVRLGGHRTAFATVEATFAAAAPGALPVPQLHLHDVSQLEVFDDGASPDFVMVAA